MFFLSKAFREEAAGAAVKKKSIRKSLKLQRESNRLRLSRRFELHERLHWKDGGPGLTRTRRRVVFFPLEGKKSSSSETFFIALYQEVKCIK